MRVLGILGQASSSQLGSRSDEPLGDQYIASLRMSAISGLSPGYVPIPAEIFLEASRPLLEALDFFLKAAFFGPAAARVRQAVHALMGGEK